LRSTGKGTHFGTRTKGDYLGYGRGKGRVKYLIYLLQSSSTFLLQVRLEIQIGEAEAIETGAKPLPEADRAGVYMV